MAGHDRHNHDMLVIYEAIEEDEKEFPELRLEKRVPTEYKGEVRTKPAFELKEIAMALFAGRGFVTQTANILKTTRQTVHGYLKRYPSLQLAREIAREQVVDDLFSELLRIAETDIDIDSDWGAYGHHKVGEKRKAIDSLLKAWYGSPTQIGASGRNVTEHVTRTVEEKQKPISMRFREGVEDAEVLEDEDGTQ